MATDDAYFFQLGADEWMIYLLAKQTVDAT
jgi:hypothetical protein